MSYKIFVFLNRQNNYLFSLHQKTSVEILTARYKSYFYEILTAAYASQIDLLTLFNIGFFGLCSHCGGHKVLPLKISKTKMIYQWDFPHRSEYPLSPLFACFRIWFVSHDVTMTSFLWLPLQIMQVRHIIAPVYQNSFAILCIGAIYVFLVNRRYTWNKKNSK